MSGSDTAADAVQSGFLDGCRSEFSDPYETRKDGLRYVSSEVWRFSTSEAAARFLKRQSDDSLHRHPKSPRRLAKTPLPPMLMPQTGQSQAGHTFRVGAKQQFFSTTYVQRGNLLLVGWAAAGSPQASEPRARAISTALLGRAAGFEEGRTTRRTGPDGRSPEEPNLGTLPLSGSEVAAGTAMFGAYAREQDGLEYRTTYNLPANARLGSGRPRLVSTLWADPSVSRSIREFRRIRQLDMARIIASEDETSTIQFSRTSFPAIKQADGVVVWEARFKSGEGFTAFNGAAIRVGTKTLLLDLITKGRKAPHLNRTAFFRLVRLQAARMQRAESAPSYSAKR